MTRSITGSDALNRHSKWTITEMLEFAWYLGESGDYENAAIAIVAQGFPAAAADLMEGF